MRATHYDGPYRISVKNKPDPQLEHPQDAVVKVTAAGVCGSDLHLLHGMIPDTRIGHTFGHEIVGVVEEVGPEVQGLKTGDRVVVPFNISCGACFYCQRGMTSCCEMSNPASDVACGVYGYSHSFGGYHGGQAEYVRVPFADIGPMLIPEGVSDEDALPLADVYPTGYQGAEMLDLKGGETVVVFGAGPVGLFAMKAAWWMGAGRVIAVDNVAYRLEFARRFAGVETLNHDDVDLVTTLKGLTNERGADASIDAVGAEANGSALQRAAMLGKMVGGSAVALNWCFHATRKGGVISAIGAYGPPFNLVDFGTAMNKAQTIRTAQCSVKRYMPHLLEHALAGRIRPSEVFTHRYPLERASEAYHTFAQKKDGCIKPILYPNRTDLH